MNFKVGDKVICKDDSKMKSGHPSELIKGEEYTVEEIIHCGFGIRVSEVLGDFLASRFEPKKPKYTSIGLSKEIANSYKDVERIEIINPVKVKA